MEDHSAKSRMTRNQKLILLGQGLIVLALSAFLLLHKKEPEAPPLRLWFACFSPDGKSIATVAGQNDPVEMPRIGELVFWDLSSGTRKKVIRHQATLRSVAWGQDGKYVAVGDFNGGSELLNPSNGKTVLSLPPHSQLVNSVSFSPDAQMIAAGSFDGTISLATAAGKEIDTLIVPGDQILSVALSPDKAALVAGGRRGKAYLYDLKGHGETKELDAVGLMRYGSLNVEGVVFAPNGTNFATASMRTVRVWETGTGKLQRELRGITWNVNNLAYSPDSRTLATVDSAGVLSLWSAETGERIRSAPAHAGNSWCVTYSRDGRRIATVGRDDQTVKLWEPETLRLVTTLRRAG
jgi:WD40 repeat protein